MNDTSHELKCHIPYMIRLNPWFLKYIWLFLYLNSWKENKKPDNKSDTYNQIRITAIFGESISKHIFGESKICRMQETEHTGKKKKQKR